MLERRHLLSGACAISIAATACAQVITFDIPAGDLNSALDAYGRQARTEIIFKVDDVRQVRSPGVRGAMSAEAALDALLAGTGVTYRRDPSGAVAIVKASADPNVAGATVDDATITVTGSRIRGATPASTVIVVTGQQMQESGQNNLGEVARSLPQSFSGGQNPGVTDRNESSGGGSSFNLRGLGPDATLTLLNGRRMAYSGPNQAIDIGAVPIAAVERIEVVLDGASAIYGSDAVGGVANIILKRDFDGLNTSARFGGATEGGFAQQQYSIVGGISRSDGGFIVALDHSRNTPVYARQRSFTSALSGEHTLYPRASQYTGMISAHHKPADAVELSIDTLLNDRDTMLAAATTTTLPPSTTGSIIKANTRTFAISPKLEVRIAGDWIVSLVGTYAGDRRFSDDRFARNDAVRDNSHAIYDNRTKVLEASANGRLGTLNGNPVRAAFGAGYRSASLRQSIDTITTTSTTNVSAFSNSRDSYFGFSEIEIPIISPNNESVIDRLILTAAARYEDYGGGDSLATPKLGAIIGLSPNITLKGSWGKSFKAPTLYQQFRTPGTYVYPGSLFGLSTPTSTVVMRAGGNPDLKSERSTTFVASLEAKPSFLSGGAFGVSYFNIRYKDRIVTPITSYVTALTTPGLQHLITRNPTPAEIDAAAADSPLGLQLGIGFPFDPAAVVAIVDSRYTNVAQQDLWGIDFYADYRWETGRIGDLRFSGLASYLKSEQILLPGAPVVQKAGTILDPPHWRARLSLTWLYAGASVNASVNYIGSLLDDRYAPVETLGALATLDLTARYSIAQGHGLLSGIDLGISAANLLNTDPRRLRTTSATAIPYDSTNHSALGRVVNFTIGKSW
ncbi:TonB-dependent receptor [Brevundimonas sp.]|uniref:TonB-dependent receptor plug domain-containing protein n=1 Tax=Brevundimonas sp. TaxID=1871086 RepID=UPI0028A15BC4|nr:TonB-dependent receptor [Brevundimonas sp.]